MRVLATLSSRFRAAQILHAPHFSRRGADRAALLYQEIRRCLQPPLVGGTINGQHWIWQNDARAGRPVRSSASATFSATSKQIPRPGSNASAGRKREKLGTDSYWYTCGRGRPVHLSAKSCPVREQTRMSCAPRRPSWMQIPSDLQKPLLPGMDQTGTGRQRRGEQTAHLDEPEQPPQHPGRGTAPQAGIQQADSDGF